MRLKTKFCVPALLVCSAAAASLAPSFAEASCATPRIVTGTAMVDVLTGEVISQTGNMNARFHPASMTKMASTIVILEAVQRGVFTLNQSIPYIRANYDDIPQGIRAITIQEILDVTSASQNGTYVSAASAFPGGRQAFLAEMNEVARRAGATNTQFISVNGLQEQDDSGCHLHYTTMRDQILIMNLMRQNFPDAFRNYFGARQTYFRGQALGITSGLLAAQDVLREKGIDIQGCKTGFILYSGAHIECTARVNGRLVYTIATGQQRGQDTATGYRIRDASLFNMFGSILPQTEPRYVSYTETLPDGTVRITWQQQTPTPLPPPTVSPPATVNVFLPEILDENRVRRSDGAEAPRTVRGVYAPQPQSPAPQSPTPAPQINVAVLNPAV